MPLLPCVEIEPAREATHAVIWLHGLGANGHDFEPIVPQLGLSDLAVRFVFPHAPDLPVTINGGMRMPAWYDILEMNLDRRVDLGQLQASADAVRALIKRENDRGIPCSRIVLAGFSQGGAVAYEAALSHPEPLAGLMALSTYLATADTLERHPANSALPTLIQHGTQDPVVPEVLGRKAHEQMLAWGYPAEYQNFRMPHAVCPEQVTVIGHWLRARLTD
ncbi:MAG: alpha/beta fold hydrolase [Natronospirillum sp.]|uniref:alpha/beta hydrolase n=1 Tax=Natronospirillum sp. TaxID=2812955 RepID=UPI0025EF0797|nr:alpha/beta fold hydrolase [Natronospirillum sp.]MCH8550953.1 alpha/beta fold hydrolase [Natronospirillum sp.]